MLRKNFLIFDFVAVFLFINLVGVVFSSEKQYTNAIIEINKANRYQLESFLCEYSVETAGSRMFRDLSKEGKYAFKEDKVFSKESIKGQDDGLLFVKNGSKLSTLTSKSNKYRLISQQTDNGKRSDLKPGTQCPWSETCQEIIFELSNEGHEGRKAEFVSEEKVTVDNIDFIKIKMNRIMEGPDGSQHKIPTTMWFNADNFMLRRFESHSEQFEVSGEITKLKKYDNNGQAVYLPLEYHEEMLDLNGDKVLTDYKVKPDSVKINPDLPEELFEIQIHPDDQVVNMDIGIEVQGPGGMRFLYELDQFEKIENIDPAKPSTDLATRQLKNISVCEKNVIELVLIPKGSFMMGSPKTEIGYPKSLVKELQAKKRSTHIENEGPLHEVSIKDDFYISKYEVTCAQFRCFDPKYTKMPSDGMKMDEDSYPVIVTWEQAVDFCKWLSKETGLNVRLPYENEWEYACRGGSQTRFFWGNNEEDAGFYANVCDISFDKKWPNRDRYFLNTDDGYASLAPVGQYKPNKYGLYDMIGNAGEWCQDTYIENAFSLNKSEYNHSQQDESNLERVYRGGSFRSTVRQARCASRWGYKLNDSNLFSGFRILVEVTK
jgi:formylglycine-generating enzyme required for sulfatase activity